MECAECQLRTRFANRLSGDDAYGFALVYQQTVRQVASVAFGTNAQTLFAGKYRAYFDTLYRGAFYLGSYFFVDNLSCGYYYFVCLGVAYVVYGNTSKNPFAEGRDDFFFVFQLGNSQSTQSTAVFGSNYNVVRYVYQTTSQITCVGSLQSGIGKPLTSTVSGDEVLQYAKPFFEVGKNRVFDNLSAFGTGFLWFSHKTTHTRQLTNLLLATASTRVEHHIHGVEALLVGDEFLHQYVGKLFVYARPYVDNLIITFVVGDETHIVVAHNLIDLFVAGFHQIALLVGDNDVEQVERQTALERHLITKVLDIVEELSRFCHSRVLYDITDNISERFFSKQFVDI